MSESYQVAHKGGYTGSGISNVWEKAVARLNKFSSVQPQSGKVSSPSESNINVSRMTGSSILHRNGYISVNTSYISRLLHAPKKLNYPLE